MSARLDTASMQRLGGSLGSHPAAIYRDEQGQRWYVKSLESAAHARNEWLAAQPYRLAGAPTLCYRRCLNPEQLATAWVDLDKRRIAAFSEAERRQAQHWLAVHAWLANWDPAGFEGDNQGVFQGQVLTLDVGGALLYRAFGDPKGRAFGEQVREIDSLRHESGNPHAQRLFGAMSEAQVREAIRVVTAIPDARIRQLLSEHGGSEALAGKLLARKADLARRLQT